MTTTLKTMAAVCALLLVPGMASAQGTLFVEGDNVGIGTPSPLVPLHVVKSAAGNATMFRVDNAGAATFEFRNTAFPAFWIFQADQDGTFKFSKLGTGGAEVTVRDRLDSAGGPTLFVDGSIQATNVVFSSLRSKKTGFAPVDGADILQKLVQIPIEAWHYKTESGDVRHLGPTAEDFNGAFGFGENDWGISTVDAYGVALASIQALHEEISERDTRIDRLEQELTQMKAAIARLETSRP